MNPALPAYHIGDTICALATAPLPAGVAVVRLSGPHAFAALATLGIPMDKIQPRTASLRPIHVPSTSATGIAGVTNNADNGKIDHALVLTFPGPASFTGEDVAELHTHGSPAVVQALLAALTGLNSPTLPIRQALPGEFTRRAVHNGKMDLTQAEGLADLISATTAAQHRQALRQLDGALGQRFESWRTQVLGLLAQVEAAIDFPDEELDVLSENALAQRLDTLQQTLHTALAERAGERVREGLRLAILGRPNAGKSTLLNLLSGRDAAIVSPLAGTTRDVITTQLDLAGFPVTLADTAGLRTTEDAIEQEGIRRALQQAASADLFLCLIDAADRADIEPSLRATIQQNPTRTLVLFTKTDLLPQPDEQSAILPATFHGAPALAANLTDAATLPAILAPLSEILQREAAPATEAALLTRSRHREALTTALAALSRAASHLESPSNAAHHSIAELMAQDLRDVAGAIGTVTGRTGTEDVLDVVFSTFCIGK